MSGADGIKGLLAKVRANVAALEACPGHTFEPIARMGRPQIHLGMKFRCIHCGGEADLQAVSWYRKGIIHAGGDPATVTTMPWSES